MRVDRNNFLVAYKPVVHHFTYQFLIENCHFPCCLFHPIVHLWMSSVLIKGNVVYELAEKVRCILNICEIHVIRYRDRRHRINHRAEYKRNSSLREFLYEVPP